MLSDREYVEKFAERGGVCPFCQSDRLEWEDTEMDATHAYQEVYCHDCGAAWLDVYQMVGWQVVTAPDPSVLATLEKPAD